VKRTTWHFLALSRLLAILLLMPAGLSNAQQAPDVPAVADTRFLVLVIPRDGWRLTVRSDGSAWINYAALPQTARTASGAVPFALLHAELRTRAVRGPCPGDLGQVEFARVANAESDALCIVDTSFAIGQFEHVWAAVVPEAEAVSCAECGTHVRRLDEAATVLLLDVLSWYKIRPSRRRAADAQRLDGVVAPALTCEGSFCWAFALQFSPYGRVPPEAVFESVDGCTGRAGTQSVSGHQPLPQPLDPSERPRRLSTIRAKRVQ
jgi:hypothetical protein